MRRHPQPMQRLLPPFIERLLMLTQHMLPHLSWHDTHWWLHRLILTPSTV